MNAVQIKNLLKDRGWTLVDVAARWGYSVFWMSRLVNDPGRSAHYNDAFHGLPNRDSTEVVKESRHIRKKKPRVFVEMYPVGRLLIADDSRYLEEGTRVAVIEKTVSDLQPNQANPATTLITLQTCTQPPDIPDRLCLTLDQVVKSFCDTGLDA